MIDLVDATKVTDPFDGVVARASIPPSTVRYADTKAPSLPECFYLLDGCDQNVDFTISWTELPGVNCKPMSLAKIIDAAMTRDFIEHGPAPQVAEPLPTFEPRRAKPALAALMIEHDGPRRGAGYCAG